MIPMTAAAPRAMLMPSGVPFLYAPQDWYWFIGADTANVWSSKRAASVPISDAEYVDWGSAGRAAPTLADMAELEQLLVTQYPPGTPNSYNPFARYNKAQSGVVVTSISPRTFGTSIADRNAMSNALQFAKSTPGNTCDWKLPDGTFIALDEAQLTTVSTAIATFVENAFGIEKANATAILGGTMTTIAEIDDAYAALSNVFP